MDCVSHYTNEKLAFKRKDRFVAQLTRREFVSGICCCRDGPRSGEAVMIVAPRADEKELPAGARGASIWV